MPFIIARQNKYRQIFKNFNLKIIPLLNFIKVPLLLIILFLPPVLSFGEVKNIIDTGTLANISHSTPTGLKPSLEKKVEIDSTNKKKAELAKTYSKASIGIVIVIGVVCLILCGFLIYTANRSPKDNSSALGLPDGSVRALIALLVIIFYVLVSVALTFSGDPEPSPLATDVTKTLGTLVVAVSAFYFGSKTAEAANKAANDAGNNKPNTPEDVPTSIIQAAVLANKSTWLSTYKCTDVEVGKKSADDVTHDIDCIVFKVADKNIIPPGAKPIPPTITYTSGGKDYAIPTDVQTKDSTDTPVVLKNDNI